MNRCSDVFRCCVQITTSLSDHNQMPTAMGKANAHIATCSHGNSSCTHCNMRMGTADAQIAHAYVLRPASFLPPSAGVQHALVCLKHSAANEVHVSSFPWVGRAFCPCPAHWGRQHPACMVHDSKHMICVPACLVDDRTWAQCVHTCVCVCASLAPPASQCRTL